jgi:hypothetical protein
MEVFVSEGHGQGTTARFVPRSPSSMEGTTADFGYDSAQHILDIPDANFSVTLRFQAIYITAKHEYNTLLIPNIFAAASLFFILIQYAYKKWIRSKGKESVASEEEAGLEADGYRRKEEDRILGWNIGRCAACVILLGISAWQAVRGE